MKRYFIARSLLLVFALLFFLACKGEPQKSVVPSITAEQVRQNIAAQKDFLILDVRTPEEFNGPLGHIPGAVQIPVQQLEDRIGELAQYKDKDILVYCRSGHRSVRGTKILLKAGYKATNMLGGMKAWNKLSKE